MTRLLGAALCVALSMALAACGDRNLLQIAPTASAVTAAACAAGKAAYADYVEARATSSLAQIGAVFGRALLDDSCSRTAIAEADAATARKAQRAERMLKRAKDNRPPDPGDLNAAKAEVSPAALARPLSLAEGR